MYLSTRHQCVLVISTHVSHTGTHKINHKVVIR